MDWRTLHARGNRTAESSGTTRAPTITLGGNEGDQSGKKCEIHIHLFFAGMGGVDAEAAAATTRRRRNICALHTDNTRSVEHRLHETCSWTSVV